MPEDKVPFFSRPLFRFLVQPEVISRNGSISANDILTHYQKEFPNDDFQKIYYALAKDLEDVLDAEFFNKNTTNALRNIRDTWSSWKKQTLKQVRRDQFETSVTKYQKNVATVVDVEASKWVEEMTNNEEVLMSNKKRNAEDVLETARPENIKKNDCKRNKLISINDGQTSTSDDESAIEDIEFNSANADTPDYETMTTRKYSSDEMGESSENNIPNDSDSNKTIEIEINHDDLEELEQQITFSSLNEWEVGTVNVSRKFKEYQRQIIASIRQKKTKLTWNNTFELLALSSIIVMSWPCPYSTFTSSEWRQVLNSNPYKVTRPILTDSLLTTFYKATNDVSLGLNCNNFTLNDDDSELGEKAGRIFNYIKGELPLSSKQKETENKHCVYNLDPFIKIIFGGEYTPYTLELNKSVNGKQRPDFSCVIDDIAILNSEIKPSGYTQLRRNQDFVKVHLKGRKSINKLLETGGLTKQLLF